MSSTDSPPVTVDPPVRRLRPGRVLLIGSLLVVVGLATAATLRFRAHRALVERFAAHDGRLEIERWGPGWLRSVVPDDLLDAFGRITSVTFAHGAGDAALVGRTPARPAHRRLFPTVSVAPIGLDDAQLRGLVRDLERMPDLRSVRIRNAVRLSDDGVRSLHTLGGLRRLKITNVPISDNGLAGFAEHFPKLTDVDLSFTEVGDGTAAELAAIEGLLTLRLDGTAVGDEGLRALAKSPSLKYLSVSNTYVTDAGVNDIVDRLPNLSFSDD